MLLHSGTRAAGKFNVSTWTVKSKKERERICKLFMETGKLFIIEPIVSDKAVTFDEPFLK